MACGKQLGVSSERSYVEAAGVSEERGRLPGIGDAYAGQGDDDGAKVLSEEAAVSGGVADGDGESGSGATAVRLHSDQPENWSSLSKSQQRRWWRERKRKHGRAEG